MTETARLVIAVDSTQVGRADSALQKFGQTTSVVERQSDSLSGAVSRLAGPLAALTAGVSIKGLIDISDNYGQMADRIKMATSSTQEYVMVQDRLLQSANKTYRPLVEAQELYIRTADAIRSLGYETSDALDITDSFSYLLVTNAASADRASSAINAYSKSIQTGKVDSESWQSILAAMPSVVETLASELGRSSNEIRDLGITGKLALADLNEGLRRSVDESKAAADGMGTTLNDAIIRAGNNLQAYLGESEKVTGASRLMSGALDTVSDNLSTVADVASGVAVAALARYSVSVAQNTSSAVLNYRAKQAQAAEELKLAQTQAASTAAALAQARANVGLTASVGGVTAATAAHEAAQKRLAVAQAATMGVGRSMLGLMGGPAGLIATVGLTALSFVEFGDKAKGGMDKAANATEQAAMRIRNATRNLLPSDVGALSFDALQEQTAQVEAQLQSARDELERFQRSFDAGNISEQWLDKPRENVAALEGALAKLKGEMEGVRFASDTAGESYSKNLERQAVLVGKVTEEQRLRAMVEAGYIKLSEEDLALATERAKRIDSVTASLKGSTSATKEQATAYQALYDRLYPAEAAQRKYTEEVDRLKTVLKGNELANAIDRLNRSIDGADATGPGDVIEEYRKELERLEDQLDPVGKATEQYQKDVERLNAAMERGERTPARTAELLAELEKQYKENTKATSDWADWTEGALDRVDSAFADAWRNIGDGFSSFRDSLTNAFKQMLAELAHMAITKPIIMQIGAMMGIGNGTQGNNGIWGSLLGGSSGSGGSGGLGGAFQAANQARSLYSMYGTAQTLLPVLQGGYASGGFGGALTGIGSYVGSLFGGAGTAASMAAGSTAAGYTGSAYASWAAAQAAGSAGAGAAAGGAGAASGALSGVGAAASNPATWAIAALLGSKSFYEAGYTLDRNQVANQKLSKISFAIDPALSAVAYSMLQATEVAQKILSPIVGEKWGNILSLGPLFSGITNTVSKALFGGAWETKDGGLALGADGGDLTAQQYIYQKKKGGLFSSSKKRTRYSALDDETMAALQETFDATQAGVSSIFKELSLTVEEGSLAGLQIAKQQISTKGKTEEEISKALNEWFGTVGESMVDELNKVFATGLDYDLAGMQAFVGNLKGVNEVLRYLDVGMYDATVAGGKLAESLSAAAGGLDALAANSQTYYAAFFTDAEKVEDTIDSIKRAFESADVDLAGSREAYRAMVEDIDLTTAAGQEMFATLMELSGQAAQYYSIVEQQAAAAAAAAESAAAQLLANVSTYYDQFTTVGQKTEDTLLGIVAQFDALGVALPGTRDGFIAAVEALDQSSESGKKMFETLMALSGQADAYYDILEARAAASMANTASAAIAGSKGALSALSAAINAQKSSVTSAYQSQTDSIKSAIDSASDSLSEMRSVAGSLRSAVNGLRLESEQYAAQSRRSAQQTISQALSGGGRIQMNAQLERALDTVSQSSEDLFGSFEDYARDYWQTYFAIESLADKADDQLSADEQAVKALESQLDQAQRFHDAELERLDGVLEGANAQLEALLGIDTSVQSVGDALTAFTAALAAAQQLQDANSSITSVTGIGGVKRQVTSEGYILDELGNQMELFGEAMRVVGNKVVGGMGASLNIGADGQLSWAAGDYEKWAKQAGIPGFATGGLHAGGLRLVGENGPELEVTGPSRIYNASQTAAMLGGGGDAASEVRGLRSDFAGMMDALRSVAKHTMQTAKRVEFLERWDFDGLPKERATA